MLIQAIKILQTKYFVFKENYKVRGQFPCSGARQEELSFIFAKSIVQIFIQT